MISFQHQCQTCRRSTSEGHKNMTPTESSPCLTNTDDVKLWPIKLHFILLYGASGGVIPFCPVLGKQLGLGATAVGTVFTVQPFMILFSKPLCGTITDYVGSLKKVMVILALIQAITYSSLLFIPQIQKPLVEDSFTLGCFGNRPGFTISSQYSKDCILDKMKNLTCNFRFDKCSANDTFCDTNCDQSYIKGMVFPYSRNESSVTMFENPSAFSISFQIVSNDSDTALNELDLVGKYSNVSSPCDCGNSIWRTVDCVPSLQSCLLKEYTENQIVYGTYQFWTFLILVCIAGSCAGSLFTLSDCACYEVLSTRPELYGKQRLFGTAGWGIVTLLTGYLQDVTSSGNGYVNYSAGFYIMLGMLFLDLIMIYYMNLSKANRSPAIWRDIGRVFASAEIVAFAVGVFISGGLCGLLWSYQYWFLKNLGAEGLLLGLTVAVQCLIAEVPFFYISGYMIKKFGHFTCLVFTFAASFLRYVLYFYLTDPWYTLPIELLHGQTYANFYSTMTSFASANAAPGTEATMLGVLGGIFEGLGVACGSLLGGFGLDQIGDAYTFLVGGLIAGASAILFIGVTFIFRWRNSKVPRTQVTKADPNPETTQVQYTA